MSSSTKAATDSTADANFQKSDPDAFEYLEQLGAGSFGKVFKVRHIATGEVYAMKTLQRTKLESGNLMRYAITERNVMSQVKHPYIVSLRYAFQTEKQFVLVMTYCSGGNLQQLLKSEQRLQLGITRHYGAEILLALTYLHEHKILYRDLKPENVVLDDDRHAMITDFGLSKEAVQGTLAKSFLGSICYLAPEILGRKGHDHTVDIYGLGVVVHNMLTGRPPFYDSNRKTMWENIRKAPLVLPGYIPADAAQFIEETMRRTPSERPGAERTADVQGHAFFESIEFDAMMRRQVPVPELPQVPRPVPTAVRAPSRTGPEPRPRGCVRWLKCLKSETPAKKM